MSVRVGACGICNKQKTELVEHHVVECRDSEDRTPKISFVESVMTNKKNTGII